MEKPELAWAAGFYEGEGSCFRTARNQIGLDIGQRNLEPVTRFQVLFPFMRITQQTVTGRPFYHVRSSKFEHVQEVAAYLWSFLSREKKDQIKRALTGGAV